jgi:hypothetical protein
VRVRVKARVVIRLFVECGLVSVQEQ